MNRLLNRRDESSRDAAQGPSRARSRTPTGLLIGPCWHLLPCVCCVTLGLHRASTARAEDGPSAGLRNPFYFVVDTIKTKRSGSGMSLRRQMAVTRREPWPSLLAPDHSLPLPLGSQPPLPFPPSLNEVMGLLRGDRIRCALKSCPCLGSARTWEMKYLYGDRPRISDQMSAPSRITSQ